MFLWNLQISKFMMSSQVLLHNASYTYAYFFWILSPIKMKFSQILVCCMTNISKMILAECWRLKTSSRLFYDFIIFKCLSWLFNHVEKYLDLKDKVNFKICDITTWEANKSKQFSIISISKDNQTMKFGKLIECNMRNIFC